MTSFHIDGAGGDGGAGDGRLHGVDGDRDLAFGADGRDHRDDAGDLLGLRDRLGAGPGGLAADVEDVRPLGDQPAGMGDGGVGVARTRPRRRNCPA